MVYDYTVTFDPGVTDTDITDFCETLKITEIGSGEIRSFALRLNADRGAFITNTNSTSTPILDEFDKIKVDSTDDDGNTFSAIYEVKTLHPTEDGLQGTVLPVDLVGPEQHLQLTHFADQFFFESAFDVAEQIITLYNTNKGSLQPTVTGNTDVFPTGFNDFPQFTANDYLFNIRELPHYDGLIQTQDRMGSSVSAGGAGDFFETIFATVDQDTIQFQGFSSGNRPDQTSIPNIIDTTSVSPGEEEGGIEATRGTVTATWGGGQRGTLPRQNQDFIGGLEAWALFPEHISGITYPADSIVLLLNTTDSQGDSLHWKANKDTLIDPPTTATSNVDWDQYFFTDFLTTEVSTAGQYSIWTNAQENAWKSNGAKTDGTVNDDTPTFDSLAVWDSNQVIVDGTFTRTWADTRALNFAAIDSKFKRSGAVYRGFRVLVDGTGTVEFAGFDNDVIQWSGTQWLIFKEPTTSAMVGVDDEGRIYQFDTDTANEWDDISGSLAQGNECYHAVWAIFNTQGINDKDNGASGNFGEFSAVTYEFRYSRGDIAAGVFNQPIFYRNFAGINLRVPFPFNSDNGNTLGLLYGDNDSLDPATFDANNMTFTAQGLTGFNNGSKSEELGPLDAFTFALKAEWRFKADGSGSLMARGNIPFRCALYDLDDTVVIQDFTLSFNNLWETVSLPVGNFQTYKARAPWSFGDLGQNIFLEQLEVLDSFRWRNIKKIVIHWLGPFDDQGRFQPWGQIDFLYPSFTDFFTGFFENDYNFKLSIDVVQFSKPLLSVSPAITTGRSLQPRFFQEPLITNKFQLDQANLAKLEIMQFRHKEYEITTQMRFDIPPGGSFFLENENLVNNSDRTTADLDAWSSLVTYIPDDDVQDANVGFRCILENINNQPPNTTFWDELADPIPNTIKLVNKKAIHAIDKPPAGPGGALSTFTGIKRFE